MIKIINGILEPEKIFARVEEKVDVSNVVSEIIDTVRKNGDKALYDYAEKFDKVKLSSLVVSIEEIEEATATSLTDLNDRVTSMNKVITDNEYVTAGALNNLYDLINAYEARIASLEAKLAAITIEE